MPGVDITRHVDPKVVAPEWTTELEDRFVQAYFDGRGVMLSACRATGVPFRYAVKRRETDPAFADKLMWADQAYDDLKRAEQQRRVMEEVRGAAYMIYDLKSRDPLYKPATGGAAGVQINVAITDRTFGGHQAVIEAIPGRAALPARADSAPVDAEITTAES